MEKEHRFPTPVDCGVFVGMLIMIGIAVAWGISNDRLLSKPLGPRQFHALLASGEFLAGVMIFIAARRQKDSWRRFAKTAGWTLFVVAFLVLLLAIGES